MRDFHRLKVQREPSCCVRVDIGILSERFPLGVGLLSFIGGDINGTQIVLKPLDPFRPAGSIGAVLRVGVRDWDLGSGRHRNRHGFFCTLLEVFPSHHVHQQCSGCRQTVFLSVQTLALSIAPVIRNGSICISVVVT